MISDLFCLRPSVCIFNSAAGSLLCFLPLFIGSIQISGFIRTRQAAIIGPLGLKLLENKLEHLKLYELLRQCCFNSESLFVVVSQCKCK